MGTQCKECDAPLKPWNGRGQRPAFCGKACRQTFNNRRLSRGAILYDLFMASRFEREKADKVGCRSIMSRLASEWRALDHGRDTTGDWEEWIANHPAFNPAAVKRMGKV